MMIHVVHSIADAPVGKLCFLLFEVTPETCPVPFLSRLTGCRFIETFQS